MADLTFNEIRKRLSAFSKDWKNATSERSQSQTFWLRFYECFGIRAESATVYEQSVRKLDGAPGFIDSFIPGLLIVEHKSAGKKLDSALEQARQYFLALKESERPRYIITSNFQNFALYDLLRDTKHECTLAQLSKNAQWFSFLVDDDAPILEESPINRAAAYSISKLHEALLRAGFVGRDLEIFLTRTLFCMFADDTGIFGVDGQFRRLVEKTRPDGRDTGSRLTELFDTLNTSEDRRQKNLDETLDAFCYVNGQLFSERTAMPAFSSELRSLLVRCAELDWSGISPAIFGAMFQGVLEAHTPDASRQASRRELGAHFTSERNILRVINPLFMDGLRKELKAAKFKPALKALYDKLPTLQFMDPACGCGNFLVIAFRELRRLENDVIAKLFDFDVGRGKAQLDVSTLCRVRVSQFYGIEIDEAAAHIARVALWITDHQMNLAAAELFGATRPTVPLVDSPTVVKGNALKIDWNEVLKPEHCSFLFGNPPFIGKQNQNSAQKADVEYVAGTLRNAGLLDYVAAWYIKALAYIKLNAKIDVAFVSTNSITQGEQVAVLWPHLLAAGIKIRFAHRTFRWSNEGKGNAAVHCVIIGFGLSEPDKFALYDYGDDPSGDEHEIIAKQINPYLVDAPNVVLTNRRSPISMATEMDYGSKPTDGGNLLLSDQEKRALIKADPTAAKWIRPFLGAEEFINNVKRWCLWLGDCPPKTLRAMPEVYQRVQAVKQMRLASPKVPTQRLAATPSLFGEIRQPVCAKYLLVPCHSSELRHFIPIGFCDGKVICGNANLLVPNSTLYEFAVVISTMHNAWMRAVCGRLESRYRYSASIVYNNFPWPVDATLRQRKAIEAAGKAVLAARALYLDSTLADLYDPLSMPGELLAAHRAVDKAVDAAYGYRGDKGDAARVARLFELYEQATTLLPAAAKKIRRRAAVNETASPISG